MSAQENLDAAVKALADNFVKLDGAVQEAVAEIKAALAAKDDAGIQAAADKIAGISAAMASDADELSSAGVAPAPAPEPAPAPQADPAPAAQPDQPAPEPAPADPAPDAPAAS